MGFGGSGAATARLPDDVEHAVRRYLRLVDRLLPGRIVGFHLIGSVALGAYRRGRSDIDFVATVDGDLSPADLRRLRIVHVASGVRSGSRALAARNLSLPGTCNGVFVRADDLTRPVTEIVPLASHTGHEFHAGRGFDVNPVQWTTLARHGVAVRGLEPSRLGLDPQPDLLRRWNLDNLTGYWVP
ncbi:MAG TPA: nucleotidyltransferase domain-containing protein [Acidimicrobiales bacterium]|nr:nucleotidyltransferase domain-containing protein [Acidimicrobiales bacterium]